MRLMPEKCTWRSVLWAIRFLTISLFAVALTSEFDLTDEAKNRGELGISNEGALFL